MPEFSSKKFFRDFFLGETKKWTRYGSVTRFLTFSKLHNLQYILDLPRQQERVAKAGPLMEWESRETRVWPCIRFPLSPSSLSPDAHLWHSARHTEAAPSVNDHWKHSYAQKYDLRIS